LLLLAVAGSAQADTYPVCDREPTPSDIEGAKGAHKAGERFFTKKMYSEAIRSWIDAYRFDCNAHRVLINIGNAYEKLGERKKAIEALQTYVDREGPKARKTAVDKLAELKAQEEAATRPPQPPPTATATPTATVYTPPNGETDGEPVFWPPWVVVGLGGAALVTGAVLFGVGKNMYDDAEAECPKHGEDGEFCAEENADKGNTGRTLWNVGGGGLALGGAAIAGGLIWYFVHEPEQADPNEGQTTVAPQLGPSFAGLSVSQSF